MIGRAKRCYAFDIATFTFDFRLIGVDVPFRNAGNPLRQFRCSQGMIEVASLRIKNKRITMFRRHAQVQTHETAGAQCTNRIFFTIGVEVAQH